MEIEPSSFFSRLLSVFFAEFDTILGPKITYQSPEGFIRGEVFESFSEYVIPKPQLCGRLVTLCTDDYKIVCFPVSIENKKYERNALLFNLGFVFDLNADTRPYEPVVRKLAIVLRQYELEKELVFNQSSKAGLEECLNQLLEDLNTYRESQIIIHETSSAFNVKLFPPFYDPVEVRDVDVPVMTTNIAPFVDKEWDLTMQQIIPYIDGVNHVKRIAVKADVDAQLVRKCIQHLLYYGCVQIVDIFQFSNVYAVTAEIQRLFTDTDLQTTCIKAVTLSKDGPSLSFQEIFRAYCSFRHGLTVNDVIQQPTFKDLNVDIRKLVVFGVVSGFLRRVHVYATRLPVDEPSPLPLDFLKLLNGRTSMDELCLITAHAAYEIEEALLQDTNVKLVWR